MQRSQATEICSDIVSMLCVCSNYRAKLRLPSKRMPYLESEKLNPRPAYMKSSTKFYLHFIYF